MAIGMIKEYPLLLRPDNLEATMKLGATGYGMVLI